MRTYFRKTSCPSCQQKRDPTLNTCPFCGEKDPANPHFFDFEHHLHPGLPWQIVYFLVGLIGFQILGVIITVVVELIYISNNPGVTSDDVLAFFATAEANFAVTGTGYFLLGGLFFLFLWKGKVLLPMFRSFASWKSLLAGVVGFAAIFAIGMLYSVIIGVIFQLIGHTSPDVNANEAAIRAMCKGFPVLSLLVFGLVGPFCEEVTYRIGLFGLATRLGKPLGYILSALVFGLIHFNWQALWTPELQGTLIDEFANLPTYIGSGAALCFLYDRFGFSASYTAHALNNVVSIVVTLATNQ